MAEPCNSCGEFHVLDYGGQRYCQSLHHFAHGFGWDTPFEPMTDEEREELKNEIKARKDAQYPGGYEQWCKERGIAWT